MDGSTRSTLFGLFVVAGRGLTASQLIALAHPIGITASNVKSHLTRMVAEGVLKRKGPTRSAVYAPTSARMRIVDGIGARLGAHDTSPWSGEWIVLALRPSREKSNHAELVASLWFDGFRPLTSGVFVRPDWPTPWARERATNDAGDDGIIFVGRPEGVDPKSLYALYDLDDFDADARALAEELDIKRREKTPERAFAARVQIGGEVARLIGHDPRLPKDIWGDRTGLKALITSYRKFEDATAPLAARFLAEVLTDRRAK